MTIDWKDHYNTICLDFDGVIHSYTSGYLGIDKTPDPPVPGAKEAISLLRRRFKVKVFSGRCREEAGRKAIEKWLKKWGIEVDEVCENKPGALVFVDDRGLAFQGDWLAMLEDIFNFRHWMDEQEKE